MPDDNKRDPEAPVEAVAPVEEKEEPLQAYWDALPRGPRPTRPEEFARRHPGDIVIATSKDRCLLRIHPDGQIDYSADYTPDEAAKTFWQALAGARKRGEQEMVQQRMGELQMVLLCAAYMAFTRAQDRARDDPSETNKFQEEMARSAMESRMGEVIEYAQGLCSERPDLMAMVHARFRGPTEPDPNLQ